MWLVSDGKTFTIHGSKVSPGHLLNHLCEKITPEHMELPSGKSVAWLGTKAGDVNELDSQYKSEKNATIEDAIKLRETWEAEGLTDCNEKIQPLRPELDKNSVGIYIEELWTMEEPRGTQIL